MSQLKVIRDCSIKVAIVQLNGDSKVAGPLCDVDNPSVRAEIFKTFRKKLPDVIVLSVAKTVDDPGTINYRYAFTYVF